MIAFAREFLYEVATEVLPLLHQHYQELTAQEDQVSIDPRWEDYAALERMGMFQVFTARHEGVLVGYGAFFLNRHLHHAGILSAVSDVLYLHPDHRKGMSGIRLIRFCESQLKQLGADKVCIHSKVGSSLQHILWHLGYATEEVTMSKSLKEQ